MSVVPAYAALIAVLLVILGLLVIRARRIAGVTIGDGGDAALIRAMRVQANLAEYAPLALLLLAMAELSGAAPVLLHGLCTTLVAGRVIHAWGVSREPEDLSYRVLGMRLTYLTLVAGAMTCLALTVPFWFV